MGFIFTSLREKIEVECVKISDILKQLTFLKNSIQAEKNLTKPSAQILKIIKILKNLKWDLFKSENIRSSDFYYENSFCSDELRNYALRNNENGFLKSLEFLETSLTSEIELEDRDYLTQLSKSLTILIDYLDQALSGSNPLLGGIKYKRNFNVSLRLKKATLIALFAANVSLVPGVYSSLKNYQENKNRRNAEIAQKVVNSPYMRVLDTISSQQIQDPRLIKLINFHKNGDLSLLDFTDARPLCARYVRMSYELIFGKETGEDNGVIGDAWNMPGNILKKKGKIIWDTTVQQKIDYSLLKRGDIIGVTYLQSNYRDQAERSETFHFLINTHPLGSNITHVMIFLGFGKNGEALVAHLFHSKYLADTQGDRIDDLAEILKTGLFEAKIIVRTHSQL